MHKRARSCVRVHARRHANAHSRNGVTFVESAPVCCHRRASLMRVGTNSSTTPGKGSEIRFDGHTKARGAHSHGRDSGSRH
eukprot:4061478-Pleurochrysis_carterae.AAC.1